MLLPLCAFSSSIFLAVGFSFDREVSFVNFPSFSFLNSEGICEENDEEEDVFAWLLYELFFFVYFDDAVAVKTKKSVMIFVFLVMLLLLLKQRNL